MDEEISIRSTDKTQAKQIMEEVVTGNIGENPYTSIPTLTCIICDRPSITLTVRYARYATIFVITNPW